MIGWLVRWRAYILPGMVGIAMFWCATWLTARDRREADATFLAQCADAGFDAAKCRFFLTATDGGRSHNTAATMQIIQSATH